MGSFAFCEQVSHNMSKITESCYNTRYSVEFRKIYKISTICVDKPLVLCYNGNTLDWGNYCENY